MFKNFQQFLTRICYIPRNAIVSTVWKFFSSGGGHNPNTLFPMFLNASSNSEYCLPLLSQHKRKFSFHAKLNKNNIFLL